MKTLYYVEYETAVNRGLSDERRVLQETACMADEDTAAKVLDNLGASANGAVKTFQCSSERANEILTNGE
jgi:hypothetical protein